MDNQSQYIAILNDGNCLLVELTEERLQTIQNKYEGDMDMYVLDALSEEFDFFGSCIDWMHINNILCAGKKPEITKV